ncbi:hypothetical protein SRHO_G00344110 [Serrasalmus rhombeus]
MPRGRCPGCGNWHFGDTSCYMSEKHLALAGLILDGHPAARCPVPLVDIESAFQEKWEKHVPYRGLGHFVVANAAGGEHFETYHVTLAEACPLHECQRGFIRTPGCTENVEILRRVIWQRRSDGKELAVVFVDFARAFDSVLHEHILDFLRQRQVDDHVIRVIHGMYMNVTTRVEDGWGGATPEIPIQAGVKQGELMSPLLFKLALDPLYEPSMNLARATTTQVGCW